MRKVMRNRVTRNDVMRILEGPAQARLVTALAAVMDKLPVFSTDL